MIDAPRATYRFQFNSAFRFSAVLPLLPYLQRLGISHIYSSPILTARAGSNHCYDVVDHSSINPELGGEREFLELSVRAREHGIGIILDIVPNHMAVGGNDNAAWLDLLQNGRSSQYAKWFDIDFEVADPELNGKVYAPFLARPYWEALKKQDIRITRGSDAFEFVATAGENVFPLRREDTEEIHAEGVEVFRDPLNLHKLLRRQNFVLDWWRNAGDRINWRRFFDITHLAALRMTEPAAFESVHAIALRLYGDRLINGIRVDHIDGLTDPGAYCVRLRERLEQLRPQRPGILATQSAWIVVEKILAHREKVPQDWAVQGTTGYDFMNEVSALQHHGDATEPLSACWSQISNRSATFPPEETLARGEVLKASFSAPFRRLVEKVNALKGGFDAGEAVTSAACERAVATLLANFRAYRIYRTEDHENDPSPNFLDEAFQRAEADPYADELALRFIRSIFQGDARPGNDAARTEVISLFNQLSAPLAAKAIEDTAFYRFGRLLSRNDVGFDADRMGLSIDSFHDRMIERVKVLPHSLLTTATHDHKRGEDVRARLAVISEIPASWIEIVRSWLKSSADYRSPEIDRGDEYLLYQMIVGAWPLSLVLGDAASIGDFAERIAAWWIKSLREAKLRSGWAAPNLKYEKAATEFVSKLLVGSEGAAFRDSSNSFVTKIANIGAMNSLVQVALRCLAPGIPDLYQGNDLWDFSLVDPDNRRPVDFDLRCSSLGTMQCSDALAPEWRDGRVKQALIRDLLALRRSSPEIFEEGAYEPVRVLGLRSDNVLAFRRIRGHAHIMVAVVLHAYSETLSGSDRSAPLPDWWADTVLDVQTPPRQMSPVVGPGPKIDGPIRLAEIMPDLPVAVWLCKPSD